MDDAGFIIGSYVLTLATVGALAWRFIRRGREVSRQVDDADKYWI
jgi:hypothetical protein